MTGAHLANGKLKAGVFGYRTLDDCSAILDYVKGSRRVVTIGGGLLGLEAARAMMVLGAESHIVHLAGHLMEMQLDVAGGAILRKAAGIKPNTELGFRAGLTIERAIVVDDHMRSIDDPDVYVVGECAQHRGRVYGLVAPLWEQGKVFADHITGTNQAAAYHGSKLATKLKVMGIEVASMGINEPAEERDEVVQFSEPKRGNYKKLIVRDGRLVGGILMGDISKAAYLMQAFDRDSPLPEERLSLLFDLGTPSQKITFDEMPATAQVCNCNGVTKGAIGACTAAGKRSARFPRGYGLPGRVWKMNMPAVANDLSSFKSFLRWKEVVDIGLSHGFGIPYPPASGQSWTVTFLSGRTTPIARRVEVWVPDAQSEFLTFNAGSCDLGADLAKTYHSARIQKDEGPIGQAWSSGAPAVSELIVDDSISAKMAGTAGFTSAVILPVMDAKAAKAIVAWYS
jgi:Rubredoxin NAD+ reductase C-terminal domain/Pyridine nucleotide-disulphide oxidoreductase